MPRCINCGEAFFRATKDSPREDCACGDNLAPKSERARARWQDCEPTEDDLEHKRAMRRALSDLGLSGF